MRHACCSILIVILLCGLCAAECFAEAPLPPGLDPVSAECVRCHNGSEGPQAGYCLLAKDGKSDGHMISVAYAARAKVNPQLRPVAALPVEVVLHEGRVTCATCHGLDPHNGKVFVMDNTGSALCRACHVQ